MREFEEFYTFERYVALYFSPYSRDIFFVKDRSGQFNLWKKTPLGKCPEQLTFFEEWIVSNLIVHPDGRIFLMADFQGRENQQIFLLEGEKGWPKNLTNKPDRWHRFHSRSLSPDRNFIAFSSNRDNISNQDIYLMDLKSYEIKRIHGEDSWLETGFFSPDGRYLTYTKLLDIDQSSIGIVDLKTGKSRILIPHKEEGLNIVCPWSPDGKGFYFISDVDREFFGLFHYSLENGKITSVVDVDRDVEGVEIAEKYILYTLNEGGFSKLYRISLKTGRRRKLKIPKGYIYSMTLSPKGDFLGLILTTPRDPVGIYILDIVTGSYRKFAGGFLTGMSSKELVEPESIEYTSFDGMKIHSLLYKPKVGGRVPVVVYLHGGPQWQERPRYSPLFQFLLSRGIAVFAPNFRGSTGYGKSFKKLIERDWGGNELRDIEEGVKWLIKQKWVNPEKIGVYGGSFGGFATLSSLSRIPQYFSCGVDVVGPSNLVTFAKRIPPSWKRFIGKLLGDPDKDKDFLLSRSPITHVDKIKVPLLIIQGANDPRVVKAESDQMVEALKKRGVEVEYIVFDDEGHGFTKRRNFLKAERLTAEFLMKYLLNSV
jgi:dipeptidyl aminopeptidase/acylaminoacyl peptidase